MAIRFEGFNRSGGIFFHPPTLPHAELLDAIHAGEDADASAPFIEPSSHVHPMWAPTW
jgi:hypothetical protein